MKEQETSEPFPDLDSEIVVAAELPADAQEVEVGIRAEGRSGATFHGLTATCDDGPQRPLDIAHRPWIDVDPMALYTWAVSTCDVYMCGKLERNNSDVTVVPTRDILREDIGSGIAIRLPLAVWSDHNGTLPSAARPRSFGVFAIDDLPVRLASIAASWGTLATFYPYFTDLRIDWLGVLPNAFKEAAAARSPRDTHIALLHLIAGLHDNHANVLHAGAPVTGVLPVTFRRFDGKIVVTGGLPDYLQRVPVGSEVEQIDGVRADQAYDVAATQVSAATDGWRDYLTTRRMGLGRQGTSRPLHIRSPDGRAFDLALPLVSDDLFAHANREARPVNGAELVRGIHYVDMDALDMSAWEQLVPTLYHAQAIVIDLRGYLTRATLELMSHLTEHALNSPTFQTPIVPNFGGPQFAVGHWEVRSRAPRFNAKIVILVDARAMSAVETVLQMIRENNLGVLVGETTGGTNGNVTYAEVPGGFRIRFTGMRVSSADGSTIQGHGYKPDYVVHPTLEGVRAGRDEILEMGVAVAMRLIGP